MPSPRPSRGGIVDISLLDAPRRRLGDALAHRAFRRAVRRTRDVEARLAALVPSLETLALNSLQARTELAFAYDEYTAGVSTAQMTVSLETAGLCLAVCRLLQPASILDLGSGFTTFVVASYRREVLPHARVISIDSDANWAAATERYLARNELAVDGGPAGATGLSLGSFELVICDYGCTAERVTWIGELPRLMHRPFSLAIVDDLHKRSLRAAAQRAVKRSGDLKLFELPELTGDAFARYAGVLIAGGGP